MSVNNQEPKKIIFITGGSGFIGRRLTDTLASQKNSTLILLSHRKKISGFTGDLTRNNLGLDASQLDRLTKTCTHIYHLGASYDTNITREKAFRVNSAGTQNLLKLACSFKKLELFSYVSTAYVCGNRSGKISENDLTVPPSFRNHYEESKFAAEQSVRAYEKKLPVVIFRPSQVVGDSISGETPKFDGPYKLMGLINSGMLFFLPGPCLAPLNIVPVDFVVKVLVALSVKDNAGKTFHLADSQPLTAKQFIYIVCRLLHKHPPYFTLPLSFGKLDFLNNPCIFDTTNLKLALKKTKLKIPHLNSYLPKIVKYYHDRI